MFQNYLKIALRNLKRFRAYTLINLIGLAIGLSVGVLILLFVTDELSYDQFHTQGDRIYKVVTENPKGGTMETNAWPVAYKLETEFPEVEEAVYTRRASNSMMVNYEGQSYEHEIFYAGAEFFDIFSFQMIEGDPKKALQDPFSIAITETMKQRYFGTDVVLGKTLKLRDSLDFKVTGVIKDIPQQSHIQFDMLASFKTFEKLTDGFSYSEGWGNFNVRNYILLKEGADIKTVTAKAESLYMENVGDWLKEMGLEFTVGLLPLDEIYLNDEIGNGFGPNGSKSQVYLVSGIAIFVVLLACINFINLTTARSVYRAKEVGLRKIVGSSRTTLLWQFLSESFIMTLLAFAVVALFIDITLPLFNQLMGKTYDVSALLNYKVLSGTALLVLVVAIFSGLYPAWVLSGYKPVEVLKGRMQTSQKGVKLRRALVIFQFFISGALVLATLVVLQQLDYMRNQDLGFDKEQVLVLDATRVPGFASHEAFKNSLESLESVESVSFNNALPGRPGWLGQWAYPEDDQEGEQVDTEYMAVDENYIQTLNLKLIAGENFDLNRPAQLDEGVIINETTVKKMGWETPENAIGKKIVSPSNHPAGTVIGVVKDYHGLGLQEEIWAQVMDYNPARYGRYYAIKFKTGATADLISAADELWTQYLGDYTFEYSFLDKDFDQQYRAEDRLMTVFILFAILTVTIAVIGLLGMVSFMVLTKTKEIGIRKVLGANVIGLASLLSREFAILVIAANLLAIPVAWYFGSQWLENFAYRMEINPVIFVIALVVTLFIAIATVSFQTIKAAMANPIDTLKDE